VVCQQLGFGLALLSPKDSYFEPIRKSVFSFNGIECRGDENSINECIDNSNGVTCQSGLAAGGYIDN
jgi:hypothetical protein